MINDEQHNPLADKLLSADHRARSLEFSADSPKPSTDGFKKSTSSDRRSVGFPSRNYSSDITGRSNSTSRRKMDSTDQARSSFHVDNIEGINEARKSLIVEPVTPSTPLIAPAAVVTPSAEKAKPTLFKDVFDYFNAWTEDGVGMYVALFVFCLIIIITAAKKSISDYASNSMWPVSAVVLGFFIVYVTHIILKKKFNFEAYCVVMLIAVTAKSIGNYVLLAHSGLSASLWGILIGIVLRSYGGIDLKPTGILGGEFFVKVGVTLLAMDFASIVTIGLPGLMVAWGDTVIVVCVGTLIGWKLMSFDIKDSIVIAGATSICGSSAATAISSSIHPSTYKDEVCKTIIALMGLFNAPLMPLMPLVKTVGKVNPSVVGAWIGGSIDSTGQVTASAQMGGDVVLKTAVIVKMAQNILIGPLCLVFTGYFQKSFKPDILLSKFPLFVVGFLITSAAATALIHSDSSSSYMKDNIIPNAWNISEWITLIGFGVIGLEIDVKAFLSKKNAQQHNVLITYLIIQTLDICSTFGWAYLMFHNRDVSDDDGLQDDQKHDDQLRF